MKTDIDILREKVMAEIIAERDEMVVSQARTIAEKDKTIKVLEARLAEFVNKLSATVPDKEV